MGKRIRPLIVILISRALNNHRSKANNSLEVRRSRHPFIISTIFVATTTLTNNNQLHPKQLQLAEIVEMIHTASLIHDDIIDNASTRRGGEWEWTSLHRVRNNDSMIDRLFQQSRRSTKNTDPRWLSCQETSFWLERQSRLLSSAITK